MKLRNLFVALLLLVAAAAQAQMTMPAIPVDTAVRIGKLDNGLTYYIRYNNWPEHRANFYIAQKVGSLQEEDNQRGLAHFLEHMCFNGTDNFEGNNIIEYCRSIGVEFGNDLNAYTSIEETVYNIDNVPTARQSSLDSCLLILRDWADGLTLAPEEIDKERGVIHEEWRLRTSAQSRMLERNLPKLYPGSKYGYRFPIGTMEVIDNFKPQELRDYYEKWYHPTNQGIIVVGDVDVDHVEAKIKELFGKIENPENPAPIVKVEVPDNPQTIVIIDKDKEQRASFIDIMMKHDAFPDSLKNTMAYTVYKYTVDAAMNMLNQRYVEASHKADCPFVGAQADDGDYIFSKTKGAFDISVTPKEPALTAEAMKAAVVEARRAAEFGFTPTEYTRFKDTFMSGLDKAYSNKDKRTNAQFYSECKGHFLDNEPMPSIEDEYNMYQQIVPAIPVDIINQVMAELVSKSDTNVVILNFNNEAEGAVYPTEEGLLKALQEARSAEVTAFVDNVKNEPLIAQLPKAGKIKKEEKNEKFGFTELTLSNGVKVAMKKTDFKKDQVSLHGEGGAGATSYPAGDVNTRMFNNVIGISGLGNFSSTELQKALAGKIANADLTMGERMMNISGSSTPKDVETMLQMVYLYFTKVNKDTAAFNNLISSLEIQLKNRSLSPDIAFSDSIIATIYGHNLRNNPVLLADLPSVDYDRILQMAKERTQSANGWDFTIIGNYDEETIRPLICQYLGALPSKKAEANSKRENFMAQGNINNTFTRKQETPKATAVMVWSNQNLPYTYEREVQADMAGQILSMEYLKKIREDASAAYSCGALGGASIGTDGYHNFMIQAYCPMKPEKKDIALQIMNDEVKALTQNIDADKLTKIKELMLKQYADNQNKNDYWSSVMTMWRKYGIDINTDGKALIESQTAEKLKTFMNEFLNSGSQATVVMLPE
jgi:zinc protease